jgi:DnaJ-class molecular chaperone
MGEVVELRPKCPGCGGRGEILMDFLLPMLRAPCMVCRGRKRVTHREAEAWRQERGPRGKGVRP